MVKTITERLREVAEHSCMAAYWFTRYEKTGTPEHRMNAMRSTMEARDTLAKVESLITASLERGAA